MAAQTVTLRLFVALLLLLVARWPVRATVHDRVNPFCAQVPARSQPTAAWGPDPEVSPPPAPASPPTVQLIAGNPAASAQCVLGASGSPIASRFNYIEGMAMAPDGALLLADTYCYCIWRIERGSHTVSVFAGQPGNKNNNDNHDTDATLGRLGDSHTIDIDVAGDVVVSQDNTGTIRKITSKSRRLSTLTSSFGTDVYALSIDAKNGIYGRDGAVKYLPTPASPLQMVYSGSIRATAVNASGDVFIALYSSGGIRRYEPGSAGTASFLSSANAASASGLSFDGLGRLVYCHQGGSEDIRMYDHRTDTVHTVATAAQLGGDCLSVVVARDGTILASVADKAVAIVRSGLIEPFPDAAPCAEDWLNASVPAAQQPSLAPFDTLCALPDGGAPFAAAAEPAAAWDPLGVKVKDGDPAEGVLSVVAGRTDVAYKFINGAPPTFAAFDTPKGLAFDAAGNLLVADSGNHVIRSIDRASRSVSYIVGEPGVNGLTSSGSNPFHARLASPSEVLVFPPGTPGNQPRLVIRTTSPTAVRTMDLHTGAVGTYNFGGSAQVFTADRLSRLLWVHNLNGNLGASDPFSVGGLVTGILGAAGTETTAIAVARNGKLYGARAGALRRYDTDTTSNPTQAGVVVGLLTTTSGTYFADQIAVDGAGALLIVMSEDSSRTTVVLERFEGPDGGAPDESTAASASSIVTTLIDAAGRIAVDRAGVVFYTRKDDRIGMLRSRLVAPFPRLTFCATRTASASSTQGSVTRTRTYATVSLSVSKPTGSSSLSPPPTPSPTASASRTTTESGTRPTPTLSQTESRSRSPSYSSSQPTATPSGATHTQTSTRSRGTPTPSETSSVGTHTASTTPSVGTSTQSETASLGTNSHTGTQSPSCSASSSFTLSPGPTFTTSVTRSESRSRRTASASVTIPTASTTRSRSVPTATHTATRSMSATDATASSSHTPALVPELLLAPSRGEVDVSTAFRRAEEWAAMEARFNSTDNVTTATTAVEVSIEVRGGPTLGAAVPARLRPEVASYWAAGPWRRIDQSPPPSLDCVTVTLDLPPDASNSSTVDDGVVRRPLPADTVAAGIGRDTLERHVTVRRVDDTHFAVHLWPHMLPSNTSKGVFDRLVLVVRAAPACFVPGVVSGEVRLTVRAYDRPTAKPALQLVTESADTGVATVTVISSLSGSPGGAIAAQRLGTLTAACTAGGDAFQEEVGFATSPSQVAIGSSEVRYYLGAALMNPVLATAFVALHMGLAAIFSRLLKTTIRQAVLAVRVPSGVLVLVLLAAQPTMWAAFVAASRGSAAAIAVVITISATFFAAAIACAILLLRRNFRASYTTAEEIARMRELEANDNSCCDASPAAAGAAATDAPLLSIEAGATLKNKAQRPPRWWSRAVWLVVPEGEWMIGPLSVEDMCDTLAPPSAYRTVLGTPLFMDYNNRGKYFMLAELFTSVLSGVSIAVDAIAGCVAGAAMLFTTLLVYAILVFGARPHALPFDRYLCYVMAAGQLVAAALRLAYAIREQPVRGKPPSTPSCSCCSSRRSCVVRSTSTTS